MLPHTETLKLDPPNKTCLLLDRQKVTDWILRGTVHRLFSTL